MTLRIFVLTLFCFLSYAAFGDGCVKGMSCYKAKDTGSSGGRGGSRRDPPSQPTYAPPTGPLTPAQCKQKDPIQWGLRFTYFRTVWAVVAVKCSSVPGSGVDKDQYKQFTITHNKDYLEIENVLGRANNSTNYNKAGREERIRKQQEQLNEIARRLGTPALQADEQPWSEENETIGKYSEITTKMNDKEYDLARASGETAYCKAKAPDYRRAMAYSPTELQQRLADCVCEKRGCETGMEPNDAPIRPAAGTADSHSPHSGASGMSGGRGSGSSGTTTLNRYDGRPPTVVTLAPARAPEYKPRESASDTVDRVGGRDGGDSAKNERPPRRPESPQNQSPPIVSQGGPSTPAKDSPPPRQQLSNYIFKTCTRDPKNSSPRPKDDNQAAYMLLQAQAFLWVYSSKCGGGRTYPDIYKGFTSVNDEYLGGAKLSVADDLKTHSIKIDDFIENLRRIESNKAGGTTKTIERYCTTYLGRFEALTRAKDSDQLEIAICR